jgi:hypothetical protein
MDDICEALSRVETEVSFRIDVLEQETKRYTDILNYLRSINSSKRQQAPPPPEAAAADKHPIHVEREEKSSSKSTDNSVDDLPAYLDDLLNLARSARAATTHTPPTTAPGKGAKRSSAKSKDKDSSSCKSRIANVCLSKSSKSATKEAVLRKESKSVSAGGGASKHKASSEKTTPRDGVCSVSSSSASVVTGAVEAISPYEM